MTRSLVIAALVVLLSSSAARDALYGQRLEGAVVDQIEDLGRQFVDILNAPSQDARAAALHKVFSSTVLDDDSVDRLEQALSYLHEEFAPLDFHHAELVQWETPSGSRKKLHAFALDQRRRQWKNFQMDIDGGASARQASGYRISGITFVADVSEPVYLPAGDIKHELDWLDEYVSRLIEHEDLFGSLLVVEGDETLYERYFGYEDERRSRPITAETRFNMASGGKMFTGVAVAQLIEDGKLDWQTPVNRYVEGTPADVLVHHLLTHTSGMSEYWTRDNEERMAAAADPQQEFLELALAAGTDFAPGTASRYSNSNFILAGHVVEAVSGRDYADYVRSEILEPAGMKQTLVSNQQDFTRNVALPLQGSRRDWARVPFTPRPTSAGGAYTTGRDMLKFEKALTNGTLLSKKTFDLMTTSKMAGIRDAVVDFGYGFILETQGQTRFAGHGGSARGVNFAFEIVSGRDLTMVMFSNQDNGAFDDLRRNIMKLVSGYR